MAENLANEYRTTLAESIDDDDTEFDLTDAPPAALSGGNFRLRLGAADDTTPEYVLVGSVSGSTVSGCTRGVEGSTAASWGSGTVAVNVLTVAGLADEIDTAVAAHTGDTSDAHDASAVSYDNAVSGLAATDVQDAIDELEGLIGSPSLALDDLTDVNAPTPADNDVLSWDDGTNTWVPVAPGTPSLDYGEDADISTLDYDDTPSAGVLDEVARADHVHGMPSAGSGGGGEDDPIADAFGAADTAFEFDTSSLTGLTAIGTVAAEDADTSVPGWYYLVNNTNASPYFRGRGVAVTTPFTAITKVITTANANFEQAGILVAPSTYPTSGAFRHLSWGFGQGANTIVVEAWSGPGTFSSTLASNGIGVPPAPLYLAIRAASATDISFYYSFTGRLWRSLLTAHNPSFTPGLIAIATSSQNTTGHSSAYDFLRIWNSAESFLGV